MGNKSGKTIFSQLWKSNKSSSIDDTLNLETFLLVWLDPNIDTNNENKIIQNSLRKILTYLITFDNLDICETWLKKCSSNKKIILIISNTDGEKFIPKIHYLPSIISICIYCSDIEQNSLWIKNYSKIRSIVSNKNKLLEYLLIHQINLENIEDSKAFKIHSLNIQISSYIWYQLFLEILLSSKYLSTNITCNQFIEILEKYTSNDHYGLNLISQFQQTYQSEQAISWLIRDTPLARFLNKALREQDINMLFILRFLLVDIHNQLIKDQIESINAFRIQPMMKSQIENLLTNPDQLLFINGFLFASTNKSQLISNITNDDQTEIVLYDIKAKYRSGVVPFAFIHNNEKKIDQEILFMCGSIFKINSLFYENSIWTLELTLISENDIPELFQMKQKLKQNQNLCMIGDLLYHCKQSNKAIIYYKKLLQQLPEQHILIPQIIQQLNHLNKSNNSSMNIQYILVNLFLYMTDFAAAILNTLCLLTSDIIYIYNDGSKIDFSKWSEQSIFLFTTAEFAESLNNLPECVTIFTLENDRSKINDQHQYTTIEDLISQLADQIIENYRLKANEYHKIGELNQVKQIEEKINQIYRELIIIHQKFTMNSIFNKSLNHIEPLLILLIPDHEDMNSIQEYFQEFFFSYHFFHNEDKCYQYIIEHEHSINIFLIIHTTNKFLEISSNIKYIYYYGKLIDIDEKIFENKNDLYYQITSDLIDYYKKLGDQYQTNNQLKLARKCFVKGQKLCQFLIEHFFE